MAAKKIAIDTKTVADLGLDDADIFNQRVVVVSLELPPEKSGGRKIDGADPAAAAQRDPQVHQRRSEGAVARQDEQTNARCSRFHAKSKTGS